MKNLHQRPGNRGSYRAPIPIVGVSVRRSRRAEKVVRLRPVKQKRVLVPERFQELVGLGKMFFDARLYPEAGREFANLHRKRVNRSEALVLADDLVSFCQSRERLMQKKLTQKPIKE